MLQAIPDVRARYMVGGPSADARFYITSDLEVATHIAPPCEHPHSITLYRILNL